MLLKNREITAAKQALQGIMNTKLPVKSSLQIARLDLKLNEPIDAFVKVRDGLFAEYKIVNKEGQFTSDTRENLEGFVKEFNELLEAKVEVDVEPIDPPEIEIEPSVMVVMDKFFK